VNALKVIKEKMNLSLFVYDRTCSQVHQHRGYLYPQFSVNAFIARLENLEHSEGSALTPQFFPRVFAEGKKAVCKQKGWSEAEEKGCGESFYLPPFMLNHGTKRIS